MELCLTYVKDPKPTERQIKALETVYRVLDIKAPKNCFTSAFKCTKFLDKYYEEAKQLIELARVYCQTI